MPEDRPYLVGLPSGGGATYPVPLLRSTYWVLSPFLGGPSGTAIVAVNRTYYTPFYFGQQTTVTAIAFNQTAGGTAGNVLRLGLYTADPATWFPKVLLGQGTQPGDTGAVKTVTFGAPLVLPAGVYWGCANVQGATSPGSGHLCAPIVNYFHSTTNPASWDGIGGQNNVFTTESGAFTDNPAASYDNTNGRYPNIALRVA